MVVVGGVEDGLIFGVGRNMSKPRLSRCRIFYRTFCPNHASILARQDADYVGGLEGADDAFNVGVQADGEFDGFEAGFAGGFDHLING